MLSTHESTWDDLESFAFGQVGLMPSDFYDLLPREWTNLVNGWNDRENRSEQMKWERVRWQTTILLNPHTKKRIKPKELIVFPWEKDSVKKKKVFTRGEILSAINERKERSKANGKFI
jgi:hypothetical protein